MRLTDLAIVFVVIMLPIVIIVYVNTSFVVRAEREEMYYKNMINSAINDATIAMKAVENDDYEIDYGYSGIVDNKVSVNANVAVDTFFTSLYNNLGIKGNKGSEESLKSYIPALAVIDYDGIYIYSAEDYDGETKYVLKPKKYFTYTYYIEKTPDGYAGFKYEVKPYSEWNGTSQINGNLIYQVTFTQDDYVFLKVFHIEDNGSLREISTEDGDDFTDEVVVNYTKAFYLEDNENNDWLLGDTYTLSRFGGGMLSTVAEQLMYGKYDDVDGNLVTSGIIHHLAEQRKLTIAKICMEEVSYAVNAHNFYAKKAGVRYAFNFSINSDSDWYETVDGIGMLAIVQGISLGNRYLNYSAYSVSDLSNAKKYYLSDTYEVTIDGAEHKSEYRMYHASSKCAIYEEYLKSIENATQSPLSPGFLYNKEEVAANGFHACYLCKP